VIALMERVAATLAERDGIIEIAGHTDARPFKGGTYDNWRLSSARAQMAYYMLVRAGVPESRIRSVTGHADRLPKVASNPLDPANRRIEIRVVSEKSGVSP
jgi:chemotaxis protein MotB